MKCINKKDNGFESFDDVKGSVKKLYINDKYEEMINNLVKNASVEINNKVYDKLTVNS